jgi:tRNA(Ile2) C34 agmatinyltransferase TiaS
MKLADLPMDTILPPRVRSVDRDEKGRWLCPECGGGLYMTGAARHRCRVCEAEFVEVEEAHELTRK